MAATRLIALHQNKGKSIARSMQERLAYTHNPEKTDGGELVTAYACDPASAWAQFLLEKNAYHEKHGREYKNDIIAYQIRQSFKPGEITPEEANLVGQELAMRFTKGNHAFTVSTHIDKKHVHNHIIFNAVALDGERKFRNFYLSGRAVSKLSDIICLEHGLSVIEPKPKRERRPYYYPNGKEKPFDLLVDMERIIREGKGAAYEKWAVGHNVKQAAKTLLLLDESNVHTESEIQRRADVAADRFHDLADEIKVYEAELKDIVDMKKTITTYLKTKDTYAAYKKSGYSQKFFEAHRADLTLHKAAKRKFDELKKAGKPIPKMKELSARYDEVLEKKRAAYQEYKEARNEMQTWQNAKKNVELLYKNSEVNRFEIGQEQLPERRRSHRDTR